MINKASIISHDLSQKNKINRFDNVNIHLKNLLVDSSTQYDKSRFVFAKEASISIPNYLIRTSDSVYFFKCSSVNISAAKRTLSAKDIELIPRRNKQQFLKKLKAGEDIFTLKTSRLTLTGIDWWSFVNRDKMIADQADIYNCLFKDFIDSSYQPKKTVINNYPHQAFMRLKMPVSIRKIKLHNANVTYEELSQSSGKTGRLYFSDMNGLITNFTNIPAEIKKNRLLYCNVKTRFMRKVPMTVIFRFDMAKTKTGEFSAHVNAGAMDTSVLNPLAEPLGLFTLKKGNVKKVVADMRGNVFKVNSDFILLYDNLYIIPLKKDKDGKGQLKKKKFTAFLANFLMIRNSNPDKGGKVRKYTYVVQRQRSPNFFGHLWRTILTGTVKTIGAPEKFAK